MDREIQLLSLQNYIKEVDKDITLILQNLQWDRSLLTKEQLPLSKCKYSENHKVSVNKLSDHEAMCLMKQHGYTSEDVLLPELLDTNGPTAVKFGSNDIKTIIEIAAEKDPLFKRGCNSEALQPLTAERLQSTYTADERRAIHDAVVSSVRTTQSQLDDDFLITSGGTERADTDKSWLEREAEQRDRRRRRTKYRAPPKTRNYSLVLRDVISSQMELLNELRGNEVEPSRKDSEDLVEVKKEIVDSEYENIEYSGNKKSNSDHKSRYSTGKYRQDQSRYYDEYTEDINRRHKHHTKHKYREHHSTKEDMRSKDGWNAEDTRRNYHKSMEHFYKEDQDRSSGGTSRERSRYKDYRDERRHKIKEEYPTSSDRKRDVSTDKYETYTERDGYSSNDRKRQKYDRKHGREKEGSSSKHKSDRHRLKY